MCTAEFRAVPGSRFAYWVSPSLRQSFSEFESFENERRSAKVGLQTSDNDRFARNHWEVEPPSIGKSWIPFVLGGGVTPFHYSLALVVKWENGGHEIRNFCDPSSGRLLSVPRNIGHFERPGITWGLRTRRFQPSLVPAGCIFSVSRYQAFVDNDSLIEIQMLCGLLNSAVATNLLRMCSERFEHPKYVVGIVQTLPVPDPKPHEATFLSQLAREGWSARRSLDTVVEVSHAFVVPALLQVDGESFAGRVSAWGERVAVVEAELERVQFEIDELCFELYGISEEDRRAITEGFGVTDTDDEAADDADEDESDAGVELDPVGVAAGLVSWAVGVAVGRFDIRLATGERNWPVEPDPFDPLPVCSPGMLTGADGLPATSLPAGYPLVPSPVLVDDPGHELDITARVRGVFDVVFGDDADIWWSDIGAALDARNGVEGWLRRGFFDHHLKTYSKSRRKAPLMWPIGTKSGSYQVWLYAHSVTPDSLFRLLGDVIEPKLAAEQRQLSDITQEFGPSPTASQRRSLDVQQRLVDEITELRDEIRAVAALWHPDLNDGIVIVLAPLWRLFAQHRAWAKELKDRWVKLAKGDYDWAQLAMHIWPERVIPKCAIDRSLAIAHNLEDTFWTQDETNPDKWHPRHTPTTTIDQLIADRTNPTITTTRNHPNP